MTGCQPSGAARNGERGAASMWVLAGAALVLFATMVVHVRLAATFARHRVESAADLAALAAASGIGTRAPPCESAARIARLNSGWLTYCALDLDDSGRAGTVRVRVSAGAHLVGIGVRPVTASARAERERPVSVSAASKNPGTPRHNYRSNAV